MGAAGAGTVGRDHVVEFTVMTGSGAPDPSVTLTELVPRVRNLDTAVDDGAVATPVNIGNGRYSFIIRGVFTTAELAGNYGWSVERTTAGRTHIIDGNVRFFVTDLDLLINAVADQVWDELRAGHVGAGSFGEGVLVQTVNAGGILAASFAAGAIDAAAIGTDAIDADAIAPNAIGASELATDAIGSAQLATSAVNEIRDSILLDSTPFNGASIAAILNDTGTDIPARFDGIEGAGFVTGTDSLEAIRDRGDVAWITAVGFSTHSASDVWAVAVPGAFTAGQAGNILGNRLDVAVSTRSDFDETSDPVELLDSGGTAGTSAAELVDDIFDEDVVAAHGTADTAGLLLRALGAAISQRANNATLNALLGVPDAVGEDVPSAVDTELTAAHGAGSWVGTSAQDWTSGEREQIRDSLGVDGTKTAATGGDVQDIRDDVAELNDTKLTTARADNLDDLDVAVSSRSSHSAADVDTVLTAAHGAGSWQSSVGDSQAQVSVTSTSASPATLEAIAHLERNGVVITAGLVSATITIFEADGTPLVAATAMAGPTGQGVFRSTHAAVPLTDATQFYARIAIVDGSGTVTNIWPVPTIGA